jgi:hypothetical protein
VLSRKEFQSAWRAGVAGVAKLLKGKCSAGACCTVLALVCLAGNRLPPPPPTQPTPVHTSPSCVLRNTRCRLLLRSNTLWAASVPEGTRLSFVDLATAEEVQAVQDAWRTVAADPDFGHDFAPAPSCQVEALPPPRKSRHVCTTL